MPCAAARAHWRAHRSSSDGENPSAAAAIELPVRGARPDAEDPPRLQGPVGTLEDPIRRRACRWPGASNPRGRCRRRAGLRRSGPVRLDHGVHVGPRGARRADRPGSRRRDAPAVRGPRRPRTGPVRPRRSVTSGPRLASAARRVKPMPSPADQHLGAGPVLERAAVSVASAASEPVRRLFIKFDRVGPRSRTRRPAASDADRCRHRGPSRVSR